MIGDALKSGFSKLMKTKRYVFMAYGINFLLAGALAMGMAFILSSSIGHSAAGENLRNGFDDLWYRSFSSQAHGLAATFHRSVVGIGAVFDGMETMLKGDFLGEYAGIFSLGFLYLLVWTFLSGGFISLYATREQSPSFFRDAAKLFPRFFVLMLMAGVVYYLLYHFLLEWLSDSIKALTRDTIDERIDFLFTVGKYFVLWMLIWSVNLIFDYSKILTAVTDHKNVLSAPLKATGLIFSNFTKTYGLYFLIGLLRVVVVLLYWIIAPGAGQSSWFTILGAFIIGQIYLLMRICIRCLFYSGQTVLFQSLIESSQ